MSASYPKPDDQKVNRVPPKFGWVDLPERRDGPPPILSAERIWLPITLEWWANLWTKPQATQWEQDGSTLIVLARLYDDLFAGRIPAVSVSPEMRQIEDRHGLNPKAMLQLRWRYTKPDDEGATSEKPTRSTSSARRKAALGVIAGGKRR